MTKITKIMFEVWAADPVTKIIFKGVKNLRESIEAGLHNEDVILSDGGQLKLARLLGQREGLDLLLNVHYDEVVDDEEESSSSSQNTSTISSD